MSISGKIDGLLRGKARDEVYVANVNAHPDEIKNLSELYQQEFAKWLVSMWERDRAVELVGDSILAPDGPSMKEIQKIMLELKTKNESDYKRELQLALSDAENRKRWNEQA